MSATPTFARALLPCSPLVERSAFRDDTGRVPARPASVRHADLLDQIGRDERVLEQLPVDYYIGGMVDRARYTAAKTALEERIHRTRAAASSKTRHGALAPGASGADALREAWRRNSLDWRRAVLSAVIDHVTIGPAVRGWNRFDPERVDVRWAV